MAIGVIQDLDGATDATHRVRGELNNRDQVTFFSSDDSVTIVADRDTNTVDFVSTGGGGGSSPLTTKGDVWGYDTDDNRIPVGSNGYVFVADSTQALGLKWASLATAGIAASSVTLTAGAGLTGGGDLTTNRSFAVGAGTGIQVNADDVAAYLSIGKSGGQTAYGGTGSGEALRLQSTTHATRGNLAFDDFATLDGYGFWSLTRPSRAGAAAYPWTWNAGAMTTITASTEVYEQIWTFAGADREWATGAVTNQRFHAYFAPTFSAVGSSTFTNVATMYIEAPLYGAHAGATYRQALWLRDLQDPTYGEITYDQVTDVLRIDRAPASVTPLTGFGAGILFRLENGAAALTSAGRYAVEWADTTSTAEIARARFYLTYAGSFNTAVDFYKGGFQLPSNASLDVSDANTGRIRYNSGTQKFEASLNTGAYAALATAGSGGVGATAAYVAIAAPMKAVFSTTNVKLGQIRFDKGEFTGAFATIKLRVVYSTSTSSTTGTLDLYTSSGTLVDSVSLTGSTTETYGDVTVTSTLTAGLTLYEVRARKTAGNAQDFVAVQHVQFYCA